MWDWFLSFFSWRTGQGGDTRILAGHYLYGKKSLKDGFLLQPNSSVNMKSSKLKTNKKLIYFKCICEKEETKGSEEGERGGWSLKEEKEAQEKDRT